MSVVHEAADLNVPVTVVDLHAAGSGMATDHGSFFTVDSPQIVIDTVKPAEDDDGAIVVRLYESMRTSCSCTLTTTLPVTETVYTDMLENRVEPSEVARPVGDRTDGNDVEASAFTLDFRPFEVKTLRLRLR